ncbi:MAG: bifunctional metallophosphatase/5'-nucleotidase [Candidatus Riflebacteria bacterium]|nr:bifunctional metallophosphatase/5'-nucleotidase [Candidatus Riflebacteria bacterium]
MAGEISLLYQGGLAGAIGNLSEGDFSRLKNAVKQSKMKNSEMLVVSCGSMLGPSAISYTDKGKGVVELMNQIGFDAMAPGPHDFFAGAENLLERAADADFPFILTNLHQSNASQTIGIPLDRLKPYSIIERGGKKIIIFGVICPAVAQDWPGWDKRVGLENPVESLDKYKQLALEADYVVLLSNMSFKDIVLLMKKLPWINAVIANPMAPDEVFIGESLDFGLKDGRRVCWTVPGNSLPGIVRIVKNGNDMIVSREASLKAENIEPDNEVNLKISEIENTAAQILSNKLQPLNSSESADLIKTVLDAVRVEMNAEIAILPPGLCRIKKIPEHPAEWDIRASFPFPDRAALMNIDGKTLLAVWKRRNDPLLGEWKIAFSGISESSGKVTVNGRPVNLSEKYRLATTEYIAQGGFGLFQPENSAIRKILVSDLLVNHFNKSSEKRKNEIDRISRKPAIKRKFSLGAAYNQLGFSDGAKNFQYRDPQALYTGSDIPGFVGMERIQRNFDFHFENIVESASSEWIAKIDSAYSTMNKMKLVDSWKSKIRYQKLASKRVWRPFADVDFAGTNLNPDIAGKKNPLFAISTFGFSRKFSDALSVFAGIGKIFRFSMDGRPQNTGTNIGYDYSSKIFRNIETSSAFSCFSSTGGSEVKTFDGYISLKFPIFKQLVVIAKQSVFGWKDETVSGIATRRETFTGLAYDFSLRRF